MDGHPIAPPYGAAVVVYRRRNGWTEFLVLHRCEGGLGPGFEGDWAWGPPSGSRCADEDPAVCARRELVEETGLDLDVVPTDDGLDWWPYYLAEAGADACVRLSDEHDRYAWVPLRAAVRMCRPAYVADAVERVGRLVMQGAAQAS